MSLRPLRAAAAITALVAVFSLASVPSTLAGQVTVRIADRLEPATLRVVPGTAVTWRNVDGDRHRMRSRSGPMEFDSGDLEPGESFTVTFRAPGRYPYLDERDDDDPAYHGTVVVADGPGTDPPSTSGRSDGAGSAPGGGVATAVTVTMRDRAFSPDTITVAAGTRITFRNADDREHTATERSGAFDSGVLGTGGTSATTLSAAGTYAYLCAIHPEMTGTITVTGGTTAPATPRPEPLPTPAPTLAASGETGGIVAPPSPSAREGVAGGGPAATIAPAARVLAGAPSAAAADTASIGRLVLVIVLVAAAGVAFARVVGGTVRRPVSRARGSGGRAG